jgi:hypothetical protein
MIVPVNDALFVLSKFSRLYVYIRPFVRHILFVLREKLIFFFVCQIH